MAVKKYARLLATYFKFNLSSCMEYRVSFFSQVLGMILNNAAFILFWGVLLAGTGPLAGYTMEDIMLIWALASSSFGFAMVLFGNCRNIARIIINGELDNFLLQPKNVYLNLLFSGMSLSAWGDFFYGFIIFFIFIGLKPAALLLFCGFVITGGILFATFFAMVEAVAFFTGNTEGFARIALELVLSFTLYPDKIYPQNMRWIFYSLLPSGFIVFIPLRIIQSFDWLLLVILFAVTIVYAVIGYRFFLWGLKRYESGNLMTTRL